MTQTHKTAHLLTLSNSSEVTLEGCLPPGQGQISSCMSLRSPHHSPLIDQSVCELCLPGCDLIHACLPCSLDAIITNRLSHAHLCVLSAHPRGLAYNKQMLNNCLFKECQFPVPAMPIPVFSTSKPLFTLQDTASGSSAGSWFLPSSVLSLSLAHPFALPLTTLG